MSSNDLVVTLAGCRAGLGLVLRRRKGAAPAQAQGGQRWTDVGARPTPAMRPRRCERPPRIGGSC